MKSQMAQSISIFLCEHCASVHISFERNGRMYAEAIPDDIEALAAELNKTITESRARKLGAPPHSRH